MTAMDDVTYLFGGWPAVLRVVFITVTGYVTLLLLLRASGRRPLARMSAFDFIITVTLGSAYGRVVTATEVGLVEAVVGFGMLILLQMWAAFLNERSNVIKRISSEEPALLYHDGQYVQQAMRRHRILEDDLQGVARKNGLGSVHEAVAIILERDGQFSVLTEGKLGDGSALAPLTG